MEKNVYVQFLYLLENNKIKKVYFYFKKDVNNVDVLSVVNLNNKIHHIKILNKDK